MARQDLADRRVWAGLTQLDVARALGCDVSNVQRYEAGASMPRPARRRRYAEILKWTPEQLAHALGDHRGEAPNGHTVPLWLSHLGSLEQAAGRICAFEPVAIHGLLQTEAYARAVESVGPEVIHPDDIARKVESRLARQAVLARRPEPLRLEVVLDESVLRRIAGDRAIMADQLDHLVDVAGRSNVALQVLPLDAGVFSASFGSFLLFTAPGASEPYMACTEDRAGPQYHDRAHELDAHARLFDFLRESALTPAASVDLITATAEAYR